MHSKALVETHLFSYVAKSLDILRLNHEITGNAGSEWKCTEGGGGFGILYKRGWTFLEMYKIYAVHYLSSPPLYTSNPGVIGNPSFSSAENISRWATLLVAGKSLRLFTSQSQKLAWHHTRTFSCLCVILCPMLVCITITPPLYLH